MRVRAGKQRLWRYVMGGLWATACVPLSSVGQEPWRFILPEQRRIDVRDPSQLRQARIPETDPPPTVDFTPQGVRQQYLTLDDAIQLGLRNSEVVRVLTGVSAASTGQTIYDPAINNTQIDVEQGRFDPTIQSENTFTHLNQPQVDFFPPPPAAPFTSYITGNESDQFRSTTGLAKTNVFGGTGSVNYDINPFRTDAFGLPLNSQTTTATDVRLSQPLLQGFGPAFNRAPIVLARIETERSFFQLKSSMQDLVGSTIEGYWNIVFARTDVWAREQQVSQGEEAMRRAEAGLRSGRADIAEVAQARTALAGFRANLISSQANLLQVEAAFRNLLGLPPSDGLRFIPVTPPARGRVQPDWYGLLALAEQQRPDLIELKLILDADNQRLIQARNNALPQLDANLLYRWNGLEGRTPDDRYIRSEDGAFNDWIAGVNFSVPLGLRAGRAGVRQQELLIAKDRANLNQGMHAATHDLAASLRNLAQYYDQYLAFREFRDAARLNLDVQLAQFRNGRVIYLNVLQAITDWGNSVSQEAQALTQYNIELANLERQTGTILETHGVRFYEERFRAIGPLTRAFPPRAYPRAMAPTPNAPMYPGGNQPAENAFDLRDPITRPTYEGPDPYVNPEEIKRLIEEEVQRDEEERLPPGPESPGLPPPIPPPRVPPPRN
jgi:outer membrane protein TolC